MTATGKIYGSSIFDQASITSAFDKYKQNVAEAIKSTKALKKEILALNRAFTVGSLNKYTTKMRSLNTAVNQTRASQSKMRSQLKLVTTQLKTQTAQVNKLVAANNKLKASRGSGSSRSSSGGGFGSFGSTAVIFAAITATRKLAMEVYNVSKQLDSLDLTMSKVTSNMYEMERAERFLLETSNRLGLDILKTSVKFATFRASAKEVGFTFGETQEIFEKFSAAGANLGRTGEEMDRIFLALEQMMSKGTVSSEELRRQLGEVLPGAVSIMANSMGVSSAALQDMLKKGEVLAKDVLPNFADELLKTFSIDVSDEVDTLVAQENRLRTAWLGFIEEIGGDDTKNAIKSVFGLFERSLKSLSLAIKGFDAANDEDGGGFLNWLKNAGKFAISSVSPGIGGANDFLMKGAIASVQDDEDERLQSLQQVVKTYAEYSVMMRKAGLEVKWQLGDLIKTNSTLKEADDAYDKLTLAINAYIESQKEVSKEEDKSAKKPKEKKILGFDMIDMMKEMSKQYDDIAVLEENGYTERANALREAHGLMEDDYLDFLKSILMHTEDLAPDATAFILKELTKMAKASDKILTEGLVDNLDEALNALRDRLRTAVEGGNTAEIDNLSDSLEAMNAVISQLETGKGLDRITESQFKKLLDVIITINPELESLIKNMSGFVGKTGEGSSAVGRFAGFDELFGDWDDASWQQKATGILELAEDFYSQIDAIQQRVFDNQMERLDQEQERIDDYYDKKMTLAGDDADLQDKIRIQQEESQRKFDEKRKALEYKQAKQAKQSAIIQSIINTAMGVTSALSLLPPASFILAGLVGVLGAAETATISSQTIPKYALGTNYHLGGLAVLGDGGRNELAIQPDGSTILSGKRDEIHSLQRGTKVVPDAMDFIQREAIKAVIKIDDQRTDAIVDSVVNSIMTGFKKAKINSRNNINMKVSLDHQLWLQQKLIN